MEEEGWGGEEQGKGIEGVMAGRKGLTDKSIMREREKNNQTKMNDEFHGD